MKTVTKTNNSPPDEVQVVLAALGEVQEKMTFLTPLSAADRQPLRSGRIGPKTWRMVQARVEAARKHRELLPATFDLRTLERDTEQTAGLLACLARLDQMHEAVSDTLLVVGHRVVQAATVAFGHIKVAATGTDQLPTSVARGSRTRRVSSGPSATEAAEAPVPEPGKVAAPAAIPPAAAPAPALAET